MVELGRQAFLEPFEGLILANLISRIHRFGRRVGARKDYDWDFRTMMIFWLSFRPETENFDESEWKKLMNFGSTEEFATVRSVGREMKVWNSNFDLNSSSPSPLFLIFFLKFLKRNNINRFEKYCR